MVSFTFCSSALPSVASTSAFHSKIDLVSDHPDAADPKVVGDVLAHTVPDARTPVAREGIASLLGSLHHGASDGTAAFGALASALRCAFTRCTG